MWDEGCGIADVLENTRELLLVCDEKEGEGLRGWDMLLKVERAVLAAAIRMFGLVEQNSRPSSASWRKSCVGGGGSPKADIRVPGLLNVEVMDGEFCALTRCAEKDSSARPAPSGRSSCISW